MKKLVALLVFAVFVLGLVSTAYAGWVNGYTRKDGTYVSGYNRSNPNSTVRDNYNYKGNTNPYTGNTGTNYYRNNPTSEYYGTTSSDSEGSQEFEFGY